MNEYVRPVWPESVDTKAVDRAYMELQIAGKEVELAYMDIINELVKQNAELDGVVNSWISVADGLPVHNGGIGCNLGDSVIVDVFADGERWPNCYYSFDDCLWYDSDVYCSISGVTHWMPLPSAPNS